MILESESVKLETIATDLLSQTQSLISWMRKPRLLAGIGCLEGVGGGGGLPSGYMYVDHAQ